ncbi:MAG: cell wall hydrolase [Lachnospiraceae bacterium]|nr:cell wall hydrolase [Lachnospiraceae bacterium]MBR1861955.1 cell wall hydrolase [Lachnospiraceae bacterium]
MKTRRKLLAFILCVLVFAPAVTGWTSVSVAGNIGTIQQQLDQAEKEKQDLEQKQEQNENELSGLKQEKNTLQGKLYELNTTLEEVGYHLEDLEDQIAIKELDIELATAALEEAIAEEQDQYDSMVLRVKQTYERNDTSIINAILHAGSLSNLLNMEEYYRKIEEYDQQKLKEFKEGRARIAEEKKRLETEQLALEELKEEAEIEKARVEEIVARTRDSISVYSGQIADTEAEIEAYEAQIAEKEKDVEYLKKLLEEERAKSRLAQNSTWRDISEVSFAEGDRTLLANLIYCEAGGEPYEGQVAVGAVVMNRVLSSVFPDTISGVIYAPHQFSPAGSGRLALALAQNKATDSCYRAADEAMSGYSNVGSCVYFRTPIEGLSGISIGGHIFY